MASKLKIFETEHDWCSRFPCFPSQSGDREALKRSRSQHLESVHPVLHVWSIHIQFRSVQECGVLCHLTIRHCPTPGPEFFRITFFSQILQLFPDCDPFWNSSEFEMILDRIIITFFEAAVQNHQELRSNRVHFETNSNIATSLDIAHINTSRNIGIACNSRDRDCYLPSSCSMIIQMNEIDSRV
jgi:hypothetical protein